MKFLRPIFLTPTFLLFIITIGNCANILFYAGLAGHSHVSSIWPVIDRLAEDGHNITFLTSFQPKLSNSKVHVVYAEDIYNIFKDKWDEGADLVHARMEGTHLDVWDEAIDTALQVCQATLEVSSTRTTVYNSQFDLVILDSAFNDCAIGLAYYQYKCPFIVYSAVTFLPNYNDDYGLPVESSTLPDVEMSFRTPMSFYEKLLTTWQPLKWAFRKKYSYYPQLNNLFQQHLNLKESTPFEQITSKASLVLMNSHYSTDYSRSLPPLFVSVSGIGIQVENQPLPQELESFLSKPGFEGFMYVSFGTAVRISKGHPALKNKLFWALGNMTSLQFVWKWEGDLPTKEDHAPSNVLFSKWLPQQDLFADKRIKGLIGHGGLNGINEAINYGVPMIMFPIFGDQDYNVESLKSKGLAIVLEITDFTQEELQGSIKELLTNKEIRQRTAEASKIFRDRPMKPLETAIWWIEYVLRNKDTSFLMPIAISQTWYERRLLDICFFIFGICTASISLLLFVCYKLISYLLRTNQQNVYTSNGAAIKRKKLN